jgi:hypothetical protein
MTTTLPVVIFLNHLKSSGRCHGILLPAPITRFSDIAAMALKYFTDEFYREEDVKTRRKINAKQPYHPAKN